MPFNQYGFNNDKSKYDLANLQNRLIALESWQASMMNKTEEIKAEECPIKIGGIYMSFVKSITVNGKEQRYLPGYDFWKGTKWEELPSGKVLYSGNFEGTTRYTDSTIVNWRGKVAEDLSREIRPEDYIFEKENNIYINEVNLPEHTHWVKLNQETPSYPPYESGMRVGNDKRIYSGGAVGGSEYKYTLRALESGSQVIPAKDIAPLGFDIIGDGVVRISGNMSSAEVPMTADDGPRLWKSPITIKNVVPGLVVFMWRRIK